MIPSTNPQKTKRRFNFFTHTKASINITLAYVLVSSLWILFSDSALEILKLKPSNFVYVSIFKGCFFVLITGLSLYWLVEKNIKVLSNSEQELKKKDEIYRMVINGTTDGLWEWDINTNFLYISPVLKEKAGYKNDNIPNSFDSWKELIHPEDLERVINTLSSYSKRQIPKYNCEYRIRMKTGEYLWIQTKGQGIWNEKGKIIRIIGTHTEITERKQIEEKLKTANEENVKLLNEAIEYDKLKTEFFTNISHEFKTPLNVTLGAIQLIESYQNNYVNDVVINAKLIKHIRVIKQNCYRLLKLINNLIDITKIDSGFLEEHLENCNIVEVIEKATFSVAEFIENKSIALTFDTNTEEKIIACDIGKIERIIFNLLSNATKYTKPGGSISVNINDLGDSVLIKVKDTGIGIPNDKFDIIFERFRQVNSSLTREQEGSGIGLSIVKSLVEIHSGEIWVTSELGQGSEFNIKLPAKIQSDQSISSFKDDLLKMYSYMGSVEFSDIYPN